MNRGNLVLSRYEGEQIVIADGEIVITVVQTFKHKVRLMINALVDIPIVRPDAKCKEDRHEND